MKKLLWLFAAVVLSILLAFTSHQHKQNLQAVQFTLGVDLHADFLFLHNYIVGSESADLEYTNLIERRVFSIVNKIVTVKNLYEQSTYQMDEEVALLHELYYNFEYVAEAFQPHTVDTDRLLEVKGILEDAGLTHNASEPVNYDTAIEQLTALNELLKQH